MREAINGEESPNFTNVDGESVTIAVGETAEETAQCLGAILNGIVIFFILTLPYVNIILPAVEAAEVLANEVHREVIYEEALLGEIPALPEDLDYGNLGIWIDPIGKFSFTYYKK